MRIDFDVVRQILITLEAMPANQQPQLFSLSGVDENIALEHLEIMSKRGLVVASLGTVATGPRRIYTAYVTGLTWEGHEFLENARNEEVWSKTKEIVKEKGGSVSFEIFTGLMTAVAMKLFGVE